MKRTLSVAAFAAVMAVAPIAVAQMNTRTDGGDPRGTPRMSTGSGLPSESPQVESMQRGTTNIDRLSPGTRSGASGSTAGYGTYGSTGTATPPSDRMGSTSGMGSAGGVMMQIDRSELADRRGRGQNNMELMQTSLLNSFSAAGFRAVRDFRKDGDRYVATAMDQTGNWVTVQMDPSTGAISSAR